MLARGNESFVLTRRFVLDVAWRKNAKRRIKKADSDGLRQRLMSMVLAAGSHLLVRLLPALPGNSTYEPLVNGIGFCGPWKDYNWSIFYKSRGAALIMHEDIISFLLSPEVTDAAMTPPLHLKFGSEHAHDPRTINTSFLTMIQGSKHCAPQHLQGPLQTAVQILEIIGKPDYNKIPLDTYNRYVAEHTESRKSSAESERGRDMPMKVGPISRPIVIIGTYQQSKSLWPTDPPKPSLVKRLSNFKQPHTSRVQVGCASPMQVRPGESLSDHAYTLW